MGTAGRGTVVTAARDIAIAGAVALAVAGGHAAYRARPLVRGIEIRVPASLVRAAPGYAAVRLTFDRVALDVPHVSPAPKEPFEPLPRIGDWWLVGAAPRVNAVRLRGRPLFVQLMPGPSQVSAAAAEMRPSGVSDAFVTGTINVAGTARTVRDDGYVWLDFAFAPLAVPESVADGPALAVLRVLPSGRAGLAGVIVNGTRY